MPTGDCPAGYVIVDMMYGACGTSIFSPAMDMNACEYVETTFFLTYVTLTLTMQAVICHLVITFANSNNSDQTQCWF